MTESLVLYVEAGWTSPWVCAVHVALDEKQLPFTTAIAMVRVGSGAIDAMQGRSLTGTAPVLQHGNFWLAESLAIIEYLEDAFPERRMLPPDVRDRARARQLMSWMRIEHDVLRRERPSQWLIYGPPADPPPLSERARGCATGLLAVVERMGADARGCLFGDFGVIDVEVAFALQRLIATNEAIPDAARAYAATVWARASVRRFLDHKRPPNAAPG